VLKGLPQQSADVTVGSFTSDAVKRCENGAKVLNTS